MGKRTKNALPCPNPLFERVLKEWRDEARDKGSKLQFAYSKALSSIQKYPLPLESGREAMILEGIGESIAKKLDESLGTTDISDLYVPAPVNHQAVASSSSTTTKTNAKQSNRSKRKGPKEYIPTYRTGAYALLLTLYQDSQTANNRGFMTKEQLQREAQLLSDKSFTLPDPGTRYTAWSSMSTLTKKGFVMKSSNPAKYSITAEGCNLAERLKTFDHCAQGSSSQGSSSQGSSSQGSAIGFRLGTSTSTFTDKSSHSQPLGSLYTEAVNQNQAEPSRFIKSTNPAKTNSTEVVSMEIEDCQQSNSQEVEPEFTLKPGTFDIVLCVDFIETTGGCAQKSRKEAFVKELNNNGVEFDVRKLQVGDFAWVARERTRPVAGQLSLPEGKELVLDYIVERKRMDDLNSSITDGRFREQKFRLKNCGLRHPVYLVEDFGSMAHLSLPETTLQQAIINTQVVDGFFVKRTRNTKESCAYLTLMTRFLQSIYMSKTLVSCCQDDLEKYNLTKLSSDVNGKDKVRLMTFKEFSKETVKNKVLSVREMFGKQLMQISGMSADKAVVVLETYPTPKSLKQAYERESTTALQEKMLSTLKYGKNSRSFGPALSKMVYQVYCTKDWPGS